MKGVELQGGGRSKGVRSWLQDSLALGRCMRRKACCSPQSSLTLGVEEGRLLRCSKSVRIQASLVRVECLKEGL